MGELIELESLAAKKKLDEESEFYLKIIDNVLNNGNNKNIAITGGYGAGKTTIIDSYFEENKSKSEKMMRVSIATFQSDQKYDQKLNSNPSIDYNLLEQQILQQMFFQVNPNRIPNSKFTKISDLSFRYTFGVLLYLIFTAMLTILIVNNSWLNQYYSSSENILDFLTSNWFWLTMVSLLIVLNGMSLWLILMFFRKLGVSKFGVATTTIEFNFKDGSTVFNHYLDEIIYLFKKTDYKYIIFEDLDRFKDINIFERLRALNTTLNRSAHIADRNIKFIYALKDDVFTGDDETESVYNRTKFFDFIIPTVKVMHSSTAESILLKKLDVFIESNQNQKISKVLIEDVALFINDMRTLINICNEFEIFRLRLLKSSITHDNLFAFIVYKNIYPSDYSNLIENKGLVFDIFNKKEMITNSLENKIAQLNSLIDNGVGSIIRDKEDIAMLFAKKRDLYRVKLKQQNIHLIATNYTNEKRYISEGTKFLDYFSSKEVVDEFTLYRDDKAVHKYLNLKEFVTVDSVNYLDLYKNFEDSIRQTKENIKCQINELMDKVQQVEKKSVSRLIKEDRIDLHVNLENNKLLYFLIRNDWLNETYEDYLTVFREGSISLKDNKFIQTIKLGDSENNFYYKLQNKEKVVEKIRIDDITSIAALNLDLIITLLQKNNDKNNEKLSKLTLILYEEIDKYFNDYLILIEELKKVSVTKNLVWNFLNTFMKNGIDIWKLIEESSSSREQKDKYVITLLEYSNIEEFKLEDESIDSLREFISSSLDAKKISDSSNLYALLKEFDVKFVSLSRITEECTLDNIVKINSYEINLNNIRKILGIKNISIQGIKNNKHLYEYCFDIDNIKLFITNVLLEQEQYIEKEVIFVGFLKQLFGGKYEVDESILQSVIQHQSGYIKDISIIDSFDLIKILKNLNKFNLTWENIMFCNEAFKSKDVLFTLDSLLLTDNSWEELISNSSEEVQKTFIDNEKYHSFVDLVLKLDLKNNPRIKEFIASLIYLVDLSDAKKKDNKVLEMLINRKVVFWNIDIYNSVQSNQHKIDYVLESIKESIDDIAELIENANLVWSKELFELINKSEEIGKSLKEKYFHDSLLNIEYAEFKSIMKIYKTEFSSDIIRILIKQANKKEILNLYLIQQWRLGSVNDLSNIINEYHLPWSQELFYLILDSNIDIAVDYLLNHIDKIEDINIGQELFEALIVKVDDNKIAIELINKFQNDIYISEQISEEIYEILLTKKEPEILLSKLNRNTVYKIIEKLPLESSSEFLYQFLVYKDFKKGDVFTFLSTLTDPFKLIKLKGGQIKITKNHSNIKRLLNYLSSKDLQVISSFNASEQGYIINNKRK